MYTERRLFQGLTATEDKMKAWQPSAKSARASGRVNRPDACQAYARHVGSGRCSRPCSGRMDLELDDMKIAIIGLGNMGGGMAANLAKAGHEVAAFDLSETALAKAVDAGCSRSASAAAAVTGADAVVTMLPAGKHVDMVYSNEVFGAAAPGTLFLD